MARDVEQQRQDLHKLTGAFFAELFSIHRDEDRVIIDENRPFGNKDVARDVLEIIGWESEIDELYEYSEAQRQYANDLYYKKLVPYLKSQWDTTWSKLEA